MIRFLRVLFGIYALLIFPGTMIITTILYAIIFLTFSAGKAPHVAHGLSQIWARVLMILLFMPTRIRNRQFIDPNRTYVMVANHQSQLDIPLYALSCKNTVRFLAKAELTKIPLMGFIIRKLYLSVNRQDRNDRNKSIEVMRKSLDEGISVFLCPEGTRNKYEEPPLLEFRDGAFRLAVVTQTPIAGFVVLNTGRKLNPLQPIALAPGTLHGIWLQPIETKGMTLEDVPALKSRIHAEMTTQIRAFRAGKLT
jgi:1-acyl-sn-glycerol-3-phosphate acyltransferase